MSHRHITDEFGLDEGFVMPIDRFIDVARDADAGIIKFVTHTEGFPRKDDVDVLLVTVRHRETASKGTERAQFRVYGIIPCFLLKRAIGRFLAYPDMNKTVLFEIERMVYK